MKIRSDFVTNSSSSSFIICTKNEFNKKDFELFLGVSEDHILNKFINNFIDFIYDQYRYNLCKNKDDFKEYLKRYRYCEDYELEKGYYADLLKKYDEGYIISYSSICNDSGDIWEQLLYENKFNIKNDNIIMEIE